MTKYEPYPAGETPKVGDRVRVTYVEEGLVEVASETYLSLPLTGWSMSDPGLTIERAIPEKPTFQEAFAALGVGQLFIIEYPDGRWGDMQRKAEDGTSRWVAGGVFPMRSVSPDATLKRITIEED